MMRMFRYKGPVYHFNSRIGEIEMITEAVSPAKALSNFSFRAKRKFGFVPETKLTLSNKFMTELKKGY